MGEGTPHSNSIYLAGFVESALSPSQRNPRVQSSMHHHHLIGNTTLHSPKEKFLAVVIVPLVPVIDILLTDTPRRQACRYVLQYCTIKPTTIKGTLQVDTRNNVYNSCDTIQSYWRSLQLCLLQLLPRRLDLVTTRLDALSDMDPRALSTTSQLLDHLRQNDDCQARRGEPRRRVLLTLPIRSSAASVASYSAPFTFPMMASARPCVCT